MKVIITVIGKDKAGIIAKISGVLAENKIKPLPHQTPSCAQKINQLLLR